MLNLKSFGSAQSLTQLMSVGSCGSQVWSDTYIKMRLKVQCVKFSLNYYVILEEAFDTVHQYMKKSGLTENNVSATFQL